MRNALKSYTEFVMCKVLHIVVISETPGTCFVLCKSEVFPFLKYLFHSLWSITLQGFELCILYSTLFLLIHNIFFGNLHLKLENSFQFESLKWVLRCVDETYFDFSFIIRHHAKYKTFLHSFKSETPVLHLLWYFP